MLIVIIIPEGLIFPPGNGGQLRVFHILRELGRHFQVHAIVGQSAEGLRASQCEGVLPQSIRFHSPVEMPPPQDVFDRLPSRFAKALRYRWLRRSIQGSASGTFLQMHHLLVKVLHSETVDAVVFEHLEAMTLARIARRYAPQAKLILDAHNVDHRLLQQELKADPENQILQRNESRTRWTEIHLRREVDAFLACSEADRVELERLNRHELPGFTVPNGTDTQAKPFDPSPDKFNQQRLLFCGSLGYTPNIDGLRWLHAEILPLILARRPNVRLRVIGRCNGIPTELKALADDPAVEFIGTVDDLEIHYRESSISVVPLRMGSGTRLKILEAMAFGTPVVSTSQGIEGIPYQRGTDVQVADHPAEFSRVIDKLLSDQHLYDAQRLAARTEVVAKYDWQVIGATLRRAIESITNS